ncbi:MAG: RNA-dependent DNA polymerase [Anaerolineales bacterium]|nr:RNA-dependent DNA polymerase [Anaerolineales bacterium]
MAFRRAAKGKRGQHPASHFEHRVADRLAALQHDLHTQTYQPGPYTHFYINEPKQRKISAAPFRDRVVHHALCNIIEPYFDQRFIPDSYANRIGKGTHRAIDRLQAFSRAYAYVLRADIVKHFPSLDHAVLRDTLGQALDDPRILWLIERILASGVGVLDDEYRMVYFAGDDLFAVNRPRGLPIGNLTSQFWSNVYMNPLDWFVVRELGCSAYLRYVDDFALFSNSKRQLNRWKQRLTERLAHLRLTIHETEAQVIPVEHGIPWLGFVVYPHHRLLKRRNLVHFQQRIADRISDYAEGRISFAELDASVQGWINHVRYADTWGLREHVLGNLRIRPPKKS